MDFPSIPVARVLMLPLCGRDVQRQVAHLHVPVELLHQLPLLLLGYVNLLHVVPEVHVFEGRKLFSLQEKIIFSKIWEIKRRQLIK